MGKLMRVTRGAAFLVAVDLRVGSPTLGNWVGIEATAENRKQVWAPASFARGFCALTEDVEVQYMCTGVYNSKAESAIRWNDPEIGIDWPVRDAITVGKGPKGAEVGGVACVTECELFRISGRKPWRLIDGGQRREQKDAIACGRRRRIRGIGVDSTTTWSGDIG